MKYLFVSIICLICVFVIGCSSGNKTVLPTYHHFNLDITSSSGGSVYHDGDIDNLFLLSSVKIHAVPNVGYVFDKWTYCNGDDLFSINDESSADARINIVDDDMCVKANFVKE